MNSNISSSNCPGLRIVDIQPHHQCYHWDDFKTECEAEWPCEVREYLVSIYPFIWLIRAFLSYGTVFIIILGLFLNSLSFYTLISSGLSKSGSGVYLISLAICDCGNLISNYAVGVARGHSTTFNQYFMESEWLCRLHAVAVDVFQLISAWIVVCFTVERCIAVWYPMILRKVNRVHRARTVIITLSTILTLFSLSKLFLKGFESNSVFGYAPCPSRRYRWQGVSYVRVAFQTWIPTIMVFTFNCLMFYKLRRIKNARKRLTETKRKPGKRFAWDPNKPRKPSFMNRPSPTAPMLVAVSLAYLVLVFPLGAVQTVELVWNVHRKVPVSDNEEQRQQFIHWKTTKLLLKYIRSFFFGFYQINFAINFFLYFAAGLQFRLHLQHKVKSVLRRLGILSCCTFLCCGEDLETMAATMERRQRNMSRSTSRTAVTIESFVDSQPNPVEASTPVATTPEPIEICAVEDVVHNAITTTVALVLNESCIVAPEETENISLGYMTNPELSPSKVNLENSRESQGEREEIMNTDSALVHETSLQNLDPSLHVRFTNEDGCGHQELNDE